jgi:hypothetical protein
METETENCNLEWICDTLLKTYNTSILDRANQFFKEACVEEAKRCVSRNQHKKTLTSDGLTYGLEREVLSQLIVNHSNESNPEIPSEDKKPIANYIGGPFYLTMQWNKEYKKLIYIFGEIHSENTDCNKFKIKDGFYGKKDTMLIEDYLEQLIRNTDVFIDFYLEIGRENVTSGDIRIGKIAERFKYCFYEPKDVDHAKPEKYDETNSNIKCWLSRMHYFDLRQLAKDVHPDIISIICVVMIDLIYTLERIKKRTESTREYPNVISDFLNKIDFEKKIKPLLEIFSEIKTPDEYNEFWDKQIDSHKFLSKKVTKSSIHSKIKSFIKREILNTKSGGSIINGEVLINLVKEFIKTIDKYRVDDIYNFIGATKSDIELIAQAKCIQQLIAINTYVADYYLLCRIFREFDLSISAKSDRWTDEPKEPHNIIIYAGDRHSEKVRKFLKEELEFKMIHDTNMYSRPSVNNCISMQDFPQPFFSNHPKVRWDDDSDDSLYEKSVIISKNK